MTGRLIKYFKIQGCSFETGETLFSGYQMHERLEVSDGMVSFFREVEYLDKVYAFVDPSMYFLISPVYEE